MAKLKLQCDISQDIKEDDREQSQKKSQVLRVSKESDLKKTSKSKQSMTGLSTKDISEKKQRNSWSERYITKETGFKFECWYFREMINGKISCAICKGEIHKAFDSSQPHLRM